MSDYRSTIQAGRWFFGFTIRRLSVFISWKCAATWVNYGRAAGLLPEEDTSQ